MRPNYHPALSDGSLDKVRSNITEIEKREPPDAGTVLLELDRTRKGEGPQKLRIAVKSYEGHAYLDLRVWWRKENGTWLPGKKGITVRARELADVQRALSEAGRLLGGSQ
jgi:hypothetical protein